MKKQNCWEYTKCGRGPEGEKVTELGTCPASQPGEGEGLNGGKDRGRICWAVAGSYCGEHVQGTFAQKLDNCMTCEFFTGVLAEEGDNLKFLIK